MLQTIGFEFEMFLLDNKGRVANEADKIMKNANVDFFVREISESMLEIRSEPHSKVRGLLRNFFLNLGKLIGVCKKMDLFLYPYGCYPGKSFPKFRESTWYDSIKMNLGSKAIEVFPRISGFHFHFCAPDSFVLHNELDLAYAARNKEKSDILLGLFNLLIAADPAICTFMQSSPFYEGNYYGKSSRMIVWRDFSKGNTVPIGGIFNKNPIKIFNSLPSYYSSVYDIDHDSQRRKDNWIRMIESYSMGVPKEIVKRSSLKCDWGPVRLNPIGTLEQRGMDMNTPMHVLGVSSLLKRILKPIFYGDLKVRVADFAIDEPFKLEDGIIYVAPYNYVRKLELESALNGFDNKEVLKYCKSFYDASMKIEPARRELVSEVDAMFSAKKTKSDDILDIAKEKGLEIGKSNPPDLWGAIALNLSHDFYGSSQKALKLISEDFELI